MATKIRIRNGQALSVYDDRLLPIYRALGITHIKKASDVTYEEHTSQWQAVYRGTGQVIAHGPLRNQVVRDEVTWLEENTL